VKKQAPAPAPAAHGVRGNIDTTYHTQQRDMFTSGLAAQIGVYAYAVWNAIKYHSDFQTGKSWPGIRHLAEITGVSKASVEKAIDTLVQAHLLRVTKRGQRNVYVARERLDVRVGDRVICTIAIDYVPARMRERLEQLKSASAGEIEAADVWAEVELIPGPGLSLDASSGTYKGALRADEVPAADALVTQAAAAAVAHDARAHLKAIADQMRSSPAKSPKK